MLNVAVVNNISIIISPFTVTSSQLHGLIAQLVDCRGRGFEFR